MKVSDPLWPNRANLMNTTKKNKFHYLMNHLIIMVTKMRRFIIILMWFRQIQSLLLSILNSSIFEITDYNYYKAHHYNGNTNIII